MSLLGFITTSESLWLERPELFDFPDPDGEMGYADVIRDPAKMEGSRIALVKVEGHRLDAIEGKLDQWDEALKELTGEVNPSQSGTRRQRATELIADVHRAQQHVRRQVADYRISAQAGIEQLAQKAGKVASETPIDLADFAWLRYQHGMNARILQLEHGVDGLRRSLSVFVSGVNTSTMYSGQGKVKAFFGSLSPMRDLSMFKDLARSSLATGLMLAVGFSLYQLYKGDSHQNIAQELAFNLTETLLPSKLGLLFSGTRMVYQESVLS